jgi:hypothetical protein
VGRLLRGTFKLAVIAAVIAGIAVIARKLMGGLGPTPGSEDAPREWPSLVPEPTETPGASNNGIEPVVAATPDYEPPAYEPPPLDDPAVTDPESDPTP